MEVEGCIWFLLDIAPFHFAIKTPSSGRQLIIHMKLFYHILVKKGFRHQHMILLLLEPIFASTII